jgi:hypothetical protein
MIIHCSSITKKQNIVNIIIYSLGILGGTIFLLSRKQPLPITVYPFIVVGWLSFINYLYQLKKTVYSVGFIGNKVIICTYWGNRTFTCNDLTFSISILTIINERLWDGWNFFHDAKGVITIRHKEYLYYVCNKNGADKEIITFLKDNNYLQEL